MATRTATPWAATATLVRQAVKAARADGTLALPPEVTIKVTSSSFAGGASADATLFGPKDWAYEPATPADREWAYHQDTKLTQAARTAGTFIADLIAKHRQAGYIWGGVYYGGEQVGPGGGGLVLGTVAREGWQPGQD